LACHLQIDANPDRKPAYHFDADLDPDFYIMRIRIRIHNTGLVNTGKENIHSSLKLEETEQCTYKSGPA
jgi:hypothetical protein